MKKSIIRPLAYSFLILLIIAVMALMTACNSNSTASPTPSASPSPTETASPSPSQSLLPTPSTTPPAITTSSLPDGVAGTAYSQTLAATGGTGAHAWGLSSGILPVGLALDVKSGTISGTPNAAATYFFTVVAVDSVGASSTQALSINVNLTQTMASALIITTNSLPAGLVGTSYDQTLSTVSSSGGLTWSKTDGALPTGLNLDGKTGIISGIPTVAGTYTFTIKAVDSSGSNVLQNLTITINSPSPTASPSASATASPAPSPSSTAKPKTTELTITTSSLPAGLTGTNYSQTLKTENGTGPFTWSYIHGALPDGLHLDAQTGIIFGKPSKAGVFYFLLQVNDSAGSSASQSLSITINSK